VPGACASYVAGNPLNDADPTGLCRFWCKVGIGAAVGGAVACIVFEPCGVIVGGGLAAGSGAAAVGSGITITIAVAAATSGNGGSDAWDLEKFKKNWDHGDGSADDGYHAPTSREVQQKDADRRLEGNSTCGR
jgi:hypothetical protein